VTNRFEDIPLPIVTRLFRPESEQGNRMVALLLSGRREQAMLARLEEYLDMRPRLQDEMVS
jgi:hypothetical protein